MTVIPPPAPYAQSSKAQYEMMVLLKAYYDANGVYPWADLSDANSNGSPDGYNRGRIPCGTAQPNGLGQRRNACTSRLADKWLSRQWLDQDHLLCGGQEQIRRRGQWLFFELLDVFRAKPLLVQQRLCLFVPSGLFPICMLAHQCQQRQCRCYFDYTRRLGRKLKELAG